MFFERMLPLLAQCKALNLTISLEGDRISVVTNPMPNSNSPDGLRVPQLLKGTAQELDDGMPEFLASLTLGVKSIQDQIAENEALVKSEKARIAEQAKEKAKIKQPSVSVKPAESDDVQMKPSGNAVSAISSPATDTNDIPADLFGED